MARTICKKPLSRGMNRYKDFMETPEFKNAYEIAKEEKKLLGPTDEQKALAALLESIGSWPIFATFTFRPNQFEEVVQSKDEVFHQNKKLSFSNTVIRGK